MKWLCNIHKNNLEFEDAYDFCVYLTQTFRILITGFTIGFPEEENNKTARELLQEGYIGIYI